MLKKEEVSRVKEKLSQEELKKINERVLRDGGTIIVGEIAKVREKLAPEEFEKLQEWVYRGSGNIIFAGKTGRGKTYAAQALLNFFAWDKAGSIHISSHEQRFMNIQDLNQKWLAAIENYRENYTNLEKLKNCLILVVDDIGMKKPSDAFLDYLYCIINFRRDNPHLRTIFTTNSTGKELNDLLGCRIVSRMWARTVIKFEGDDLRLIY